MSIFTSLWFWVLILGILLTIAGIIAWAVTGNADVLVGILLGAGVGWIIGGLLIWIFGRPKKPDVPAIPPSIGTFPSTMSSTFPSATMSVNPSLGTTTTTTGNTMPSYQSTMTTNPSLMNTTTMSPPQTGNMSSQQQLMQLLQANPQLLSSYSGSPKF